jgi:hypothetical protein
MVVEHGYTLFNYSPVYGSVRVMLTNDASCPAGLDEGSAYFHYYQIVFADPASAPEMP